MLPTLHRALAFVVSTLITRQTYISIGGGDKPPSVFVGDVNEHIDVQDYQRETHVRGWFQNGNGVLHDARSHHRLIFSVQGNTFEGTDPHSGTRFRGSVDRDRIYLFDEQHIRRYVFTAQFDWRSRSARVLRPPLSRAEDQRECAPPASS